MRRSGSRSGRGRDRHLGHQPRQEPPYRARRHQPVHVVPRDALPGGVGQLADCGDDDHRHAVRDRFARAFGRTGRAARQDPQGDPEEAHMNGAGTGNGPLSDIRVLDLSRFIAGPFCAQLLGDMGADVVKVERPRGEDARHHAPFLGSESLYVLALNRNKRAMTLDTRHPSASEVLERMLRDSDVLVENYRPGTLAAMGFGPDRLREINPRLIVTSISGFGQSGPLAERALFDAIAQAMSGLMSLTGEGDAPTLAGTYVADYVAGLYGALGTVLALRHRGRTGEGQVVDVASLDGLFSCLATQITATANLGVAPSRTGARDALNAPANVFRAKDGYLYLHGGTNPLFPRLCRAMRSEEH